MCFCVSVDGDDGKQPSESKKYVDGKKMKSINVFRGNVGKKSMFGEYKAQEVLFFVCLS